MVEDLLEAITKLIRVVNDFFLISSLFQFLESLGPKNILGAKQDENTLFGFILKIGKLIFSSQSNITFLLCSNSNTYIITYSHFNNKASQTEHHHCSEAQKLGGLSCSIV